MLRIVEKGKCFPVTLEEARDQLSVDSSNRSNDALILTFIEAATQSTEQHTGRIWVESKWEWIPDEITVGKEIEFPAAPVTKVQVYDLDEADQIDISGDVVFVKYPSPEPQGSPLMGSLLPMSSFPTNFRIVLTIGYPVEETVNVIEQNDAPILVSENTRYSENKVALVFNRPVNGTVIKENFDVLQDGQELEIESIEFNNGRLELTFPVGILTEASEVKFSFIGGEIFDQFESFVEPIFDAVLPNVVFVSETDFVAPDPVPTESTYYSQAPSAVKTAILLNVGFLYTQRTGSALKSGREIEKNFSDQVAACLLNPYRTRFF